MYKAGRAKMPADYPWFDITEFWKCILTAVSLAIAKN
jgi:hypothetical protein